MRYKKWGNSNFQVLTKSPGFGTLNLGDRRQVLYVRLLWLSR